MKQLLRTVPYALAIVGVFMLVAAVTHVTARMVVNAMQTTDQHIIVSFYGAELASRFVAAGIVFWKLSVLLSQQQSRDDFKELFSNKATLLAFALLASMFMGLDNRLFWWLQYFSGGVDATPVAELTAYRAAFITCSINLISLMLLGYHTLRGNLIGLAALSAISFAGFAWGYYLGA